MIIRVANGQTLPVINVNEQYYSNKYILQFQVTDKSKTTEDLVLFFLQDGALDLVTLTKDDGTIISAYTKYKTLENVTKALDVDDVIYASVTLSSKESE